MRKILKPVVFIGLALTVFTAACNLVVLTPPAEAPLATVSATQTETSLPTATLTESAPTASATPEFAPFCEAGAETSTTLSTCDFPAAEEISTYCSEKDPYNLILVEKGLTYEPLTEGIRCLDSGIKDGKQLVACTGPLATDFELSVCDPSCVIPTVQAAITSCPQDYNYNSQQGCCTNEIQTLDQNCQTFEFKTGTCVVRCFEFGRESKCKRNAWACEWNDKDKVCELRK
jgi:hypothetical protein